MAFFVNIGLLPGLFATDVEAATMALAIATPATNHVHFGFLAADVHQARFVISFALKQVVSGCLEVIQGQIDAGYGGVLCFDEALHALLPAWSAEGASMAVKVEVQRVVLTFLRSAARIGDETNPAAFMTFTHDGDAEAVEVLALFDHVVNVEAFAEGCAGFFCKPAGLQGVVFVAGQETEIIPAIDPVLFDVQTQSLFVFGHVRTKNMPMIGLDLEGCP